MTSYCFYLFYSFLFLFIYLFIFCISLMISDTDIFKCTFWAFVCLLFGIYLFRLFVHFLIGLLFLSFYWVYEIFIYWILTPCCCLVTKSWLLFSWGFPGKNIWVGCHFLLQGIFLTQGLNLSLLLCRRTQLLSHQGSPNLQIFSLSLYTAFSFCWWFSLQKKLKSLFVCLFVFPYSLM